MVQLHHDLIASGIKGKDIANALAIFPSAYSSLVNKVLLSMSQLHPKDRHLSQKIKSIFDQVNNVSETKTRKNLPLFIEQLEDLYQQVKSTGSASSHSYIDSLVTNSPPKIMKLLQGIYECYYVSSFGYRIKREPLLISYNAKGQHYRIKKGNDLGPAQYQGFGYISNNHLFTIHISEINTLIADNFLAHFHLPPSYAIALDLLKGISISMSNAYLPISRKVILHRLSSSTDLAYYNSLETTFYEPEESEENNIVNYLQGSKSFMEYVPIPHPDYDVSDLQKEKKVISLI